MDNTKTNPLHAHPVFEIHPSLLTVKHPIFIPGVFLNLKKELTINYDRPDDEDEKRYHYSIHKAGNFFVNLSINKDTQFEIGDEDYYFITLDIIDINHLISVTIVLDSVLDEDLMYHKMLANRPPIALEQRKFTHFMLSYFSESHDSLEFEPDSEEFDFTSITLEKESSATGETYRVSSHNDKKTDTTNDRDGLEDFFKAEIEKDNLKKKESASNILPWTVQGEWKNGAWGVAPARKDTPKTPSVNTAIMQRPKGKPVDYTAPIPVLISLPIASSSAKKQQICPIAQKKLEDEKAQLEECYKGLEAIILKAESIDTEEKPLPPSPATVKMKKEDRPNTSKYKTF